MFATCRVLFVAALGLGFGASPARADDKKPEKPVRGAEVAKTLVIQLDASKLPPDVLRQLLQAAEKPKAAGEPGKPGAKPSGEPGKPGTKATGEPVKPGVKPGTKPEGEPAKPGVKATGEPTKPGVKPTEEPVKPGTKPTGESAKPGTKPAGNAGKPGKPDAGEPGKTVVIQLDASKLPPDVLRQLLQAAEKPKPASEPVKPGTKPTNP